MRVAGSATGEISRTTPSAVMPGLLSSDDDDLVALVAGAGLVWKADFGDGEHGVLVVGPRQAHDHLADVDDLAGLGTDRRDDAVEVGDAARCS